MEPMEPMEPKEPMEADERPADDPDRGHRPVLVSITGDDTVRVTLEHRETHYVGESTRVGADSLALASANAALHALTHLTDPTVGIGLDWCGVIDPGGTVGSAVIVFATVTVAGVAMPQVGSALVHHDVQVAAVRAALDAVNRRLDVLGT